MQDAHRIQVGQAGARREEPGGGDGRRGGAAGAGPDGRRHTYPGRNGSLANETSEGKGSVLVFAGISSIPQSSAANCQYDQSNPDGRTDCSIGRISFSPDGERIVAARDGAQGQLEVLDSDGDNVTVLNPLTSDDEDPAFLPGGTRIVFTGSASHHPNLYEVGTDGSGLTQLTKHGGEWGAPCASGRIAYVNRGALYVMRANGGDVRRLVKRNVTMPDCAPNSRSVVYQEEKCAARRSVVSPAQPGGTRRRVLGSNGLPRSER